MGAILAGGASRRMGEDKALVPIDGLPMAHRVAAALTDGGCDSVILIGADPSTASALGIESAPDRWPGEGPLGGIATALGAALDRTEVPTTVVIAACDQPDLSPDLIRRLVDGLTTRSGGAQAAVGRTGDGRRHPFPSAWDPSVAPSVEALVAAGERRADAAWSTLVAVEVAAADREVADIDTPEELADRPTRYE